jgi:hypothetical protein
MIFNAIFITIIDATSSFCCFYDPLFLSILSFFPFFCFSLHNLSKSHLFVHFFAYITLSSPSVFCFLFLLYSSLSYFLPSSLHHSSSICNSFLYVSFHFSFLTPLFSSSLHFSPIFVTSALSPFSSSHVSPSISSFQCNRSSRGNGCRIKRSKNVISDFTKCFLS